MRRIVATLGATVAAAGLLTACQTTPAPQPALPGPLIYFQRAPIAGWQSVDWSGKVRVAIGTDHVGIPYQSPDGSRLVWSSSDGNWQIVDRTGKRLRALDLNNLVGYAWADDSSGLCLVRALTGGAPDVGGKYELEYVGTDGGSRTIATFSANRGPNVAACSPSAGRISVTTASGYKDPRTEMHVTNFGELLIVDFKSGSVVRRQTIPATVRRIVVSHDAVEAAFTMDSTTEVVNLSDGNVVADIPGVSPPTFSWDGSRLAVAVENNRGRVIGLPRGDIIWSDSRGEVAQGAVAQPNGTGFMFMVTTAELNYLVVVSAGGRARILASNVFVGQLAPCADCSAY